jgi:IS1 family transposase
VNRLSADQRRAVAHALVEGNSIRATCRMTGVAKGTVTRFLVALGRACDEYQDAVLRDLPCRRIQADEIWAFVYAKQRNIPKHLTGAPGIGDAWTWTAICQDTKLIPTWLVGLRDKRHAALFIDDLAARMAHRIELVTDGHPAYLDAVAMAFADGVDYAQLVKQYGSDQERGPENRYSPYKVTGVERRRIMGQPVLDRVSTSNVERANLTMRMSMRRFTRLTNGFSKKFENLEAAVALHFMHYNFARPHGSLGGRTPAMAAGISRYRWSIDEIVELLAHQEARSTRPTKLAS